MSKSLTMSKERLLAELGEGVTETFDPELKRAFDVADNEVPAELKDPSKLRMKEGMFKLSGDSVFYTLQGEGPTMGEPATFVRLHICNLRCTWCDAYYTWNPKSEEFWTEPQDVTIEDTAEMIKDSWKAPDRVQKRVVMTGGEPMLQQDKIVELLDQLGSDWVMEIETNGTIMPNERLIAEGREVVTEGPDYSRPGRVRFNCSPKLNNSGNIARARIKPEVLQQLDELRTSFKFVVMNNEDLDEIEKDFIEPGLVSPHNTILMPQGVTAEEVHMNAQRVAEYAKEKGFRLLGRLQNEIWGAKRGV